MSAKIKTVIKNFDYMHCDDFAQYLSDMAKEGWHFIEWGVGLKFEKGEPENAVYAVEVFQKATDGDMRPEPDTEEFAEYCESAGWKFVDAKKKFCIFKKIDQEAVELFTPEERVDNILKGISLKMDILSLVLTGLLMLMSVYELNSMFVSNIFSGIYVINILVWTTFFVWQLLLMIYNVFKSRALKKKVRTGEKIYIGDRKNRKYCINIMDIYRGLLIIILNCYLFMMEGVDGVIVNAVIIIGCIILFVFINKLRPERETTVAIQTVFGVVIIYFVVFMIFIGTTNNDTSKKDSFPLAITDYRESDDVVEDISYNGKKNFLGSVDEYIIYGKTDYIYYNVYRSKHMWILDKIWEVELAETELVDCTSDWGAQMALCNNEGSYYIRYEDSILIFNDYDKNHLSQKQIEIILDKLEIR